jgi:hypothetical protein
VPIACGFGRLGRFHGDEIQKEGNRMRVVLHELKKIWNFKTVAAIVLLCVMFYFVFMSFYIDHSPNNPNSAADFAYCAMLTQRYGTTLEPDEFEEFMQIREELIREADGFIAENSRLTALGIRNYAELQKAIERLSKENPPERESRDLDTIFEEFYDTPNADLHEKTKILAKDSAANWVGNNINAVDRIAELYAHVLDPSSLLENGVRGLEHMPGAGAIAKRNEERAGTEEFRGILPSETPWYTVSYARYLAILAVLATLILLAPLLVTDRIRKVHLLQYTSEKGRGILGKQLLAVLCSSVFLTTVLIAVFGAIYAGNGTQIFWNNYVASFYSFFYMSVPITFGQYVMVMIGMIYLLGMAISALAFILSRFSINFVALIAGLIPIAIAASMLCVYIVFEMPLNAFHAETGIALFEPIVCATLLVFGTAAAFSVVRRERKIDIV